MRGAAQSCAVDGDDLRRRGAIDRDEDDATGRRAVRAGIYDDVGDVARSGLQRRVAEDGIRAVEIAKRAEAGERVGISAVRRPEASGENPLRSEDTEVVGLRDRSGDVIPAAAFVFADA